ncbi:MAG: DL-methionine transporter permease subunit [Candidatus Liberibacter europaeus]|uniref:DL-methionine transporter permease subunit n=1 Tax=Candidatus Liberibacter europaeus TaxID=744859 RepID=A0A2T4VXX4_9HYPH|nr:DL-methionine transporter permease subunit [Candidatus Liberibacter europaeus]PTL86618.1 MAG: DL-methionine transporter permease subunit [Candidatus Liberibacter europaeus]
MSTDLWGIFFTALLETFYMTSISGIIGSVLGVPIGLFLATSDNEGLFPAPVMRSLISLVVNTIRSIPFMILVISMIPITRYLIGTSIGIKATIVPLSVIVTAFVARLIEVPIREVSKDLIEMGVSVGASPLQIVLKILIVESKSGIVRSLTMTFIGLINYSSVAGAIGGGGLGDLAIRYGHQRFMPEVTFFVMLAIVILVQVIQVIGEFVEKLISKHHS